jgi:hypothetical protein
MTTRPTLTQVAKVYTAAAAKGLPPTKAVRERFDISQSTSGAWVSQARAAGLLPKSSAGDQGHVNVKALRVAKALGVEYDDLVRAVRRYADGDLRLP